MIWNVYLTYKATVWAGNNRKGLYSKVTPISLGMEDFLFGLLAYEIRKQMSLFPKGLAGLEDWGLGSISFHTSLCQLPLNLGTAP